MKKVSSKGKNVVKKFPGNRISDTTIKVLSLFKKGKQLSVYEAHKKINKKEEVINKSYLTVLLCKLTDKGVLDRVGYGIYVKGKKIPESYSKHLA